MISLFFSLKLIKLIKAVNSLNFVKPYWITTLALLIQQQLAKVLQICIYLKMGFIWATSRWLEPVISKSFKAGTNGLNKNDLLIGNFKMTILIIYIIQKYTEIRHLKNYNSIVSLKSAKEQGPTPNQANLKRGAYLRIGGFLFTTENDFNSCLSNDRTSGRR